MNKNLGVEDIGATKWSFKKTNLYPLFCRIQLYWKMFGLTEQLNNIFGHVVL